MKCLLIFFLLLGACSYKKTNQVQKGHDELYSEPEKISPKHLVEDEKRIIIASTNDLEGNLTPEVISFSDKFQKDQQVIQIGGQDVMAQYFKILRETYHNVLLVDSGDILTAGDSSDVRSFYEKNSYDALTFGARDFNLRTSEKDGSTINKFKSFTKSSTVPTLLSNLFELKTARTVEWEGTLPHLMKEIDGVKVGVIGLIPDDVVEITPVQNRVGLFVESMLQSTLKNARLLRSLGAEVIVVLSHQSIDCHSKIAQETKLPPTKVNFDPSKPDSCNLSSPLGQFLSRLPPGLVDVVVGGRSHQKMANLINGTVVLGGFPRGKSFNYAEIVINTKSGKVNPKKTLIHQPVFFCHEFFSETNDCFYEDESINHKKRSPAYFLGKRIDPILSSKVFPKNPPSEATLISQLESLKGHLLFTTASNSASQLMAMNFSGAELTKILEEDFNCGKERKWLPSPFKTTNHELHLSIEGMVIDPRETYTIVSDLDSIQTHPFLKKKLKDPESKVFPALSWNPTKEEEFSRPLASAD
jgi:hypothetical protein